METILKPGMRLKSPGLDCYHIIKTVTEKRVSYAPEIPNGGLRSNKNTIRVYTTSVNKANQWLETGSWIIENN